MTYASLEPPPRERRQKRTNFHGEEGRDKFIATIHEISNVKSSQPSTITTYNGISISL